MPLVSLRRSMSTAQHLSASELEPEIVHVRTAMQLVEEETPVLLETAVPYYVVSIGLPVMQVGNSYNSLPMRI